MTLLRMTPVLAVGGAAVAVAAACAGFSDGTPPAADGGPDVASDAGSDANQVPDASANPVPEAGGGCVLGMTPSLVASVVNPPSKLVSSGAEVFWIEGNRGLLRASLLNCQTQELAGGNISALAVDPQWIVWGDPTYHVLGRTAADLNATTVDIPVDPSLILVGGPGYWLSPSDNIVNACPTPCTTTSAPVVIDAPKLLAGNAARLFFFGVDPDGGTTVNLWSHAMNDDSYKLTGPLASNQDPALLVASAVQVVWVTSDGQLHAMPAAGGLPLAMPLVPGAVALALDDLFIYVATATTIVRVSVAGATVATPVASSETGITSLALTSDAVVWASTAGIRRVHK